MKLSRLSMAGLVVVALGGCAGMGGQPQDANFFVTSKGKGDGANLGGLDGADAHCSALAGAAGLKSDRGWPPDTVLSLEDPIVNRRDRFHSQLTGQAAVPFESQRPPGQRVQDFEATACGAREHRLYIGVSGEAREQLSAQRRPRLRARLQSPAPLSSACPRPHEPRGTHRAWSRAQASSRRTASSCTQVRRP